MLKHVSNSHNSWYKTLLKQLIFAVPIGIAMKIYDIIELLNITKFIINYPRKYR